MRLRNNERIFIKYSVSSSNSKRQLEQILLITFMHLHSRNIIDIGQIIDSVNISFIISSTALEVLNAPMVLPIFQISHAKVIMDFGVMGREPDCTFKLFYGFFVLPLLVQAQPQVVVAIESYSFLAGFFEQSPVL